MEIGVCIFDDEQFPTTGWASLSGKAPERVTSPSSLNTKVAWVTNLSFPTFRKYNLNKAKHLTDEQFFRTSIKMITEELGLLSEGRNRAQIISKIFQRVAQIGLSKFDTSLEPLPYRFHNLLTEELVENEYRASPNTHTSEITIAIKEATQQNQALFGSFPPKGSNAHIFTFPRSSYAQWLFKQKYPINNKWTELKQKSGSAIFGKEGDEYIRGSKGVISRLKELGEKNAIFLNTNIVSMETTHACASTFGAGANHTRGWATLPEVLNIARYAKVEIKGGFMCPSGSIND